MKTRRIFLFVFCMYTLNVTYGQSTKFKVSEKIRIKGSFLEIIDYNDSLNWENNQIIYCLITKMNEPDYFMDSNILGLNNSLVKINANIEDYYHPDCYKYYPLFHTIEFKYSEYQREKFKPDSIFKMDLEKAMQDLLKDSLDFFTSPNINYDFKYGLYLKCINIQVEGYLLEFSSFEDYQNEFICTTNDIKSRKLVGIYGNRLGAKLFRLNGKKGSYVVLLPTKVILKGY